MILTFFICGILSAIPFVFPNLFFISWFSFIPMIYLLIKKGSEISKTKSYFIGFFFGLGFYGVMYHWFSYLYPMEFAGLGNTESIAVIAACWIGLAVLQTLDTALLTLFYRLLKPGNKSPILSILVFSGLWGIFEWQQNFFWRGVPWARLALSQRNVLAFLQSASLLGNIFVAVIIVTFNGLIAAALYYLFENKDKKDYLILIKSFFKNKKSTICIIVAFILFFSNFIFGIARLHLYDEKQGDKYIAGVIQGNISSLDKWADNSAYHSTDLYLELTEKCVNETGAQIIVWPESVITTNLRNNSYIKKQISEVSKRLKIYIFVGAFDKIKDSETDNTDEYNAIYLFQPDGSIYDSVYHKRKPVPFGEYTPLEPIIKVVLPILYEVNILTESMSAGDGTYIFKTNIGNFGSLICFDSIYELLSYNSVRDGAQLLTLSTNDSWFRDSAGVYQHNGQASLRAIETGRYVVRAANTGVSSIVNSKGEILAMIDPLIEGYSSAEVYLNSSYTLFDYVGDIFIVFCFIDVIIITVVIRKKNKNI